MAAHYDDPTPTQRDLLQYALDNAGIERLPGGFWVKPGCRSHTEAATFFGTTTVDASKRREWLRPDIDLEGKPEWQRVHIITPYGLDALKRSKSNGRV